MDPNIKTKIRIETYISAPLETVWRDWTTLEDIVRWNNASDDWHTTKASNDLREGGRFNYRMEAKNGSSGFDFAGTYDEVVVNKKIKYTLNDNRKVKVIFCDEHDKIKVVETFEAEDVYSVEMQHSGWQAILDNFKKYTERKNKG